MTSSEVLFILAFIVLPTAILVSSIWAVIFVRRRPDRVPQRLAEEPASPTPQVDHTIEQTEVFPAVGAHTEDPLAAETDQPAGEEEIGPPWDEAADDEWREQAIVAASEPVEDDLSAGVEPDIISIPEDQTIPEPEDRRIVSTIMQNTDDLGEVVAAIAALDDATEPDDPAGEVLDEDGDGPLEIDEDDTADAEDETRFVETSELPVIPTDEDPETPAETASQEDEPSTESPSTWRRRKGTVKLRPGDPDVPKHRGRKGESSRQVPQLSRSFRRRDDAVAGTPPEPDADQESTPGRE